MNGFFRKHEDRIHGVLPCFDRMLFRGYLPIMSGWSMAQPLQAQGIDCSSVKPFLLSNAERVKAHALARACGAPVRRGRLVDTLPPLGAPVRLGQGKGGGEAKKVARVRMV
jgi:hypothetical protein